MRINIPFRFTVLIFVISISIISLLKIPPFTQGLKLGLDLKGGMYILARVDTSKLNKDEIKGATERAIEVIRNRIDQFGVSEVLIQPQGNNYILIQLPGAMDKEKRERALKIIKSTAYLEFKLVEEDKKKLELAAKGELAEGVEVRKTKNGQRILLKKETLLTGEDLLYAQKGFDVDFRPIVKIRFSPEGAKKFAKITKENKGKQLAILLDGVVISAPEIKEPILDGKAQITGRFTSEEAQDLALTLRAGALPAPLVVEQENTVGPLLGSDSIQRGIKSIFLGGFLVLFFMFIYYILGGVISIICVLLDILFILGGLGVLGATLTLPGIAGIILTLGMAVDSNVLIFERIREELNKKKKPLILSITLGFDRARATIVDANVTTLIAAIFLFIYGTGPIKGFATTLILGIIASMFTAIFIGRMMFYFLLKWGMKRFVMLEVLRNRKINFIKIRNLCLTFSVILVILSITLVLTKKNIYSIDFTGGQILQYKITPPAEIETVRKILREGGIKDVVLQEFKDIKGGIIIKSKKDIASEIEDVLSNDYDVKVLNITTIGPVIGDLLKKKAINAIIFSLIGILCYIAIRFKHWDFAFAAVVALFHDIIISLGMSVWFGYEISLLTVTALLTIAGYSINDTIVVYDRIREVMPRMPKATLGEIVNIAINETISRTIITSFTTILVVLTIFIFGGEALKGFSFVLLVGFIVGTYSSIYIASPLVLILRELFYRRR